jgi:hypothetical protein
MPTNSDRQAAMEHELAAAGVLSRMKKLLLFSGLLLAASGGARVGSKEPGPNGHDRGAQHNR